YIQRKQSEGKTKLEAIRCLKRHIARQIYNLLDNSHPQAEPPPSPTPTRIVIKAAPAVMPCAR
ncbi:MAG: hypothetical protein ACTHMY_25220, partial [Solirubrobacteraceae bacterium]